MNELKINTGRLGSDAGQVKTLKDKMEKELTSMKSEIDAMNSMWQGPAKQEFVKAFEDDRSAAAEVIRELKSLQGFETQAKDKYEKCEHQVSSLVDSIRI